MRTRLLFLVLAITIGSCSFAKPLDREAAKSIAQRVLKGKFLDESYHKSKIHTKAEQVSPAYYIFNATENKGFVIVSADDEFPQVLAYSYTGFFDEEHLNPGTQCILKSFSEYVQNVRSGARKSPDFSQDYEEPSVVVEPMIKTQWEQGYPYNIYCPKDGEKNSLVGCVATSFAQIMKYWEWPRTGKNTLSYTCALPGYGKIVVDFNKSEYDWANMPNTKAEIVNNEVNMNAVGKLCYECGVATRMNYSASASGTQDCYSMQALYTYMRYKASTMVWHRRNCYASQEEWDAVWKEELDAGRPLLYAGTSKENGGHAFILDGYDSNGYAHVNWGWGGNSDGFYSTILMGGNGNSFPDNQRMITGIQPDYDDTDNTPRQWRAYMEEGPKVNVTKAQKLGVTTMCTMPIYYNICEFYCTWEVGIGLYDKQGKFIANVKNPDRINGDVVTIAPYKGINSSMVMITLPKDLKNGDYVLRACFKQDGYDEWELPYTVGGDIINKIPVMIEDGMAYYNEVSVAIVNIDEDITNNENHLPHYYTLQGQQVTAPHKGLYIRNGRKMLIK